MTFEEWDEGYLFDTTTLKMKADWKAEREELQEWVRELEEALYAHRADLHCYSSRPCPTCRNSAEVLGIADKVPYCCSREETDTKAREALQHKEE